VTLCPPSPTCAILYTAASFLAFSPAWKREKNNSAELPALVILVPGNKDGQLFSYLHTLTFLASTE
jgi:hypothetical protein